MVANHSDKATARRFMAASNGRLSYTEALKQAEGFHRNLRVRLIAGRTPNCYTVKEATALGLNWEHLTDRFSELLTDADLKLAAIAAATLSPERDLVIFGKSGAGKSAALDAVLAATGLTAKILSRLTEPHALLKGPEAESGQVDIIAVDEAMHGVITAQFEAAERRIIVVHAMDEHNAVERIRHIHPDFELRNPLYLEATRNSYDIRGLRLFDPNLLGQISAEMSSRRTVLTVENMGVTQTVFETAPESSGGIDNVLAAAEGLQQGRDIVVFGGTGSGKSTLADSIIELSKLRSVLFVEGVQRYARRASNAVVLDNEAVASVGGYSELSRLQSDLIAVDELRNSSRELEMLLELAPSRLIVVHAATPKIALGRIAHTLPSTTLRKPLLIEAAIESWKPARVSRLIDPS